MTEERESLTSTELAARHGVGRDRMECLLVEMGLRRETGDGSTRYDPGEVERRFAARDEALIRAAAEFLDYVPDVTTAVEILHRAVFELRLSWLQSRAAGDVIDLLRRQIASRLPSLHAIQRARAGAGEMTELEALNSFEHAIVTALRERRAQQASPAKTDSLPSATEGDTIPSVTDPGPVARPAHKRRQRA